MSDINVNKGKENQDEISVNGVIAKSYNFFVSHFNDFRRLMMAPLLLWIFSQLCIDILYYEFDLRVDPNLPLAFITASFALVWYRQFLLGTDHATYEQLYSHVFSRNNFTQRRVLGSVGRILVISVVLFVPTLIISLSFMVYQMSQGVLLDDAAIKEVSVKTTSIVVLMFSPIMIRFSQYTVAMSLGRFSLKMKEVWKKTAGSTWILWLLIIRAFLPLSLYTYFLKWGLGRISGQLDLHYIGVSLFVNIPTAILTFMVLAIVVAANAQAFKALFGVRAEPRE